MERFARRESDIRLVLGGVSGERKETRAGGRDPRLNGKGPREGPFDSEGRATSETLFPWLVSPQALIGRCIQKHRIS
jgi:hypothetical protein